MIMKISESKVQIPNKFQNLHKQKFSLIYYLIFVIWS